MEIAIPHLRILDYEKAVSFYVDTLGFEIAFGFTLKFGEEN